MKKIIFIILMLASANAFAKPTTGFHEGPYLLANVGILNYTVDNNIRTNTQVARDWEPSYGINFGWNIKDYIAPELEIRYATNKNNGNREQAVDVNLNVVYTFIATPLVMNDAMAFLPFVQAGPMVQFAGIPGDSVSSDNTMVIWGPGIGAGAGMRFMFLEYGYAGILAQVDFVHLPNERQSIYGAPVQVIDGGWDIQSSFHLNLGVHF